MGTFKARLAQSVQAPKPVDICVWEKTKVYTGWRVDSSTMYSKMIHEYWESNENGYEHSQKITHT